MTDRKPETTTERVCEKCRTPVYYDNGDVLYHCSCGAPGWKWADSKTTPEEVWRSACLFMREAIADCLTRTPYNDMGLPEDILTFPIPPYLPPAPKEILQ